MKRGSIGWPWACTRRAHSTLAGLKMQGADIRASQAELPVGAAMVDEAGFSTSVASRLGLP